MYFLSFLIGTMTLSTITGCIGIMLALEQMFVKPNPQQQEEEPIEVE